MQTTKLTRKSIAELKPLAGKQSFCYWDETLPDFGVQVHPSGRKYYLMRHVKDGKQVKTIIGPCELIDLSEVRATARKYLAAMIELPVYHPHTAAIQQRTTTPPVPRIYDTEFKDFCLLYMERHARLHKESWKLDETRIRKYLLPAFGSIKLADLTRGMVASLHQDIGTKFPYQANRVREQLSAMIELARVWELLPENFSTKSCSQTLQREIHTRQTLSQKHVAKIKIHFSSFT